MAGVDARTGKPLHGDARIVQSIRRLVQTDGDLALRRHLAHDLIDAIGAPNNAVTALAWSAKMAGAIVSGEPRAELRACRFLDASEVPDGADATQSANGQAWLYIDAVSRETGKRIELTELVA
ncbi:MAG: hypothetical protein AAFQ10_03430 [Pseudomonadota bacterium]